MIPRQNEVAAALEVIESEVPLLDDEGNPVTDDSGRPVLVPAYDTSKDMSKAVVKAVAAELAKRQTYVIVPAGLRFGYGPYNTPAEAEKAWIKEIGGSFDSRASLVPVHPWSPPDHHTAGVCACGHQPEIHVVRNLRGGKTSSPAECGISKCPCTSFTERKKAA